KANVWLVNTGWTGGAYGTGRRMSLPYTRALVSAALDNKLADVPFRTHDATGLTIPESCAGVPSAILDPRNTWKDKEAYDHQANELAAAFLKNFERFSADASKDLLAGAPKVGQLS